MWRPLYLWAFLNLANLIVLRPFNQNPVLHPNKPVCSSILLRLNILSLLGIGYSFSPIHTPTLVKTLTSNGIPSLFPLKFYHSFSSLSIMQVLQSNFLVSLWFSWWFHPLPTSTEIIHPEMPNLTKNRSQNLTVSPTQISIFFLHNINKYIAKICFFIVD